MSVHNNPHSRFRKSLNETHWVTLKRRKGMKVGGGGRSGLAEEGAKGTVGVNISKNTYIYKITNPK